MATEPGAAPAAHPVAHRRAYDARPARLPRHQVQIILVTGATLAFFAWAAALLLPQAAGVRPEGPAPLPATSPAPATNAPLSRAELDRVVSYAAGLQSDDSLVQIRPGVFAKQSNVSGVSLEGRTVYYDIFPHQSFGPMRSQGLAEPDVQVLGRIVHGDALVIVYALK